MIFSDPNVMAAFHSPPFSGDQMQAWMQRNLDHQDQHGFGLFSVLLKETNQLIGDCGLEMLEVTGETVAELGYDFRSDCWNQGYATEAASTVRDFAFQQLRLPRLISLIRQSNLPSQRVAEKIGMSHTSSYTRNGIDYVEYSMLASAQPANPVMRNQ